MENFCHVKSCILCVLFDYLLAVLAFYDPGGANKQISSRLLRMITTSVAIRKILFEAGCVGTCKILQLRQWRTAGWCWAKFLVLATELRCGGVCLIPADDASRAVP